VLLVNNRIVFLAEKRASVQQETGCNSMSHISKMLGGMWTDRWAAP